MFEVQKSGSKTTGVLHKPSGTTYGPGTRVFDFVVGKKNGTEFALTWIKECDKREKQVFDRLKDHQEGDVYLVWCLPKDGHGLPCVPEWLLKSDNWDWFTDRLKVKESLMSNKVQPDKVV